MTEPRAGTEQDFPDHALQRLAAAAALRWRVKDSFRSYVQRSGGALRLVQPVEIRGGAFRFPRLDGRDIRFAGGVLFSAHAGLLKVLVGEPSLRMTDTGLGLFVAHPSAPESFDDQWRLADVEADLADGAHLAARLTAEGAAYFGGAYTEGTELDPLEIEY